MSATAAAPAVARPALDAKLSKGPGKVGLFIFGVILIIGVAYAGFSLMNDLGQTKLGSAWPYVLLGVALLVALGFEFVNGFHDTANAVATVIYTHSLEPHIAVVWSGFWNFVGVVLSTGAVAFGIISLLPDYFGLPVSTTHVLSSGVAGTMAANRSGLQMSTVRNLCLAWVLTLPASIVLAGFLFWAFRSMV